jgi:RHS repeat-associated protein
MPTTKYIWDEDNLLIEADGTNTINVVYTNEPRQYGNHISTRIAGTTSYHHFDALGSTRQLTNSAGTVTDTMVYDAWGNVVSRTGTTGISMLWIGEVGYYTDSETGLLSVRRRPYGPATGRWTTIDPTPPIIGLIWFVYAENSPISVSDPSGLVGLDGATEQVPSGQAGMAGVFAQQVYLPKPGDIRYIVDPRTGNILLFMPDGTVRLITKAELDLLTRSPRQYFDPDPSREVMPLNDPPIVDTAWGPWDRRKYGEPPDILRRPPGGGGFLKAPPPAGKVVLNPDPDLWRRRDLNPRIADLMRRALRGEDLGGDASGEIFVSPGEGGFQRGEPPEVKGAGVGIRIPLYRFINGRWVFIGFVDMRTNPDKWQEDESFWPPKDEPEPGNVRIRE